MNMLNRSKIKICSPKMLKIMFALDFYNYISNRKEKDEIGGSFISFLLTQLDDCDSSGGTNRKENSKRKDPI